MRYLSIKISHGEYSKITCWVAGLVLFCMNSLYAQDGKPNNVLVQQKESEATLISSTNVTAAAPYLTKDNMGRPVISWIEEQNQNMMYYAILNEDGSFFKSPTPIPPSEGLNIHHEMMPKIAFKPDGEIIAVWPTDNESPENKYGGLTYYAQSFDGGDTWTDPIPITTDTASNDQRYFDLTVLNDGNAAIIWLDNRSEYQTEGSTLFYASTKGNEGFQDEKIIGRSTCQCCRTDIHVDSHGYINVVYRNIFNTNIRDMAFTVSRDGGSHFSAPQRISFDNWEIAGCPHTGPTMTSNSNGLHFYWYTMGGGEGVYYTSTDNYGKHFRERKLFSKNARHPQAAVLSDGSIAVVWDEFDRKSGRFNNKIGLQLKGDGKYRSKKTYLTTPTVDATYPVIIGLANGTLMVAWSQEKTKSQVYYSFIDTAKFLKTR